MKSTELTDILRRNYLAPNRPAGGLFAVEVGSPDGRRRADALWMPLTTAGGQGLVGHELKVSRSDVIVELADPLKAEPWSQYCDRWWLVVPDPSLVEGLEIPEAWGIMSPPSGRRTRTMTVLRPAPKLKPRDPAPGVRRLLSWHFYRATDRETRIEDRARRAERLVDGLRAQLEEARAGVVGSPHNKRVAGIIHAAEKRLEAEHLWARLDEEAVVNAIVDAAATRNAAEDVRHRLERLVDQLAEPLGSAHRAVEKAVAMGDL